MWIVKNIMESDFGCEERSCDEQLMVIVMGSDPMNR